MIERRPKSASSHKKGEKHKQLNMIDVQFQQTHQQDKRSKAFSDAFRIKEVQVKDFY